MSTHDPNALVTQPEETSPATDGTLSGAQRVAVVLLALGSEHGERLWQEFDDVEIREITRAMVALGPVTPATVERLLSQFVETLSGKSAFAGNVDAAERLLNSLLPKDRVAQILAEIKGPAGRNMWEKLSNVHEGVLASYLRNEYPQTVAVILSQIDPEHAARVLAILPDELSLDVIQRMLQIDNVQRDVLDKLEQTLRTEFMASLTDNAQRDTYEIMADIFNHFDRQTEARFMTALDEEDREAAAKIKTLMFTFDDLVRLDGSGCQALMRVVDKAQLAIALKGASEDLREFFFGNMSARAARLLQDDMDALGPMRLSEVDQAQAVLVSTAKDMAAAGDIVLSKGKGDEDMVY